MDEKNSNKKTVNKTSTVFRNKMVDKPVSKNVFATSGNTVIDIQHEKTNNLVVNKKLEKVFNNNTKTVVKQKHPLLKPADFVFKVQKNESLLVSDEDIKTDVTEQNVEKKVLETAIEKVKEQKSKRSKWYSIAFFIINIFIIVGILLYQLNTFGVASITDLFNGKTRFIFLLYVLLMFVVVMMLESIRTYILIYKATKISRPYLSYKASAISRYYDCITPFTSGGQPFEVYYLGKRGVRGGIATSIPLAKIMFSQLAFLIISLVVLIASPNLFGKDSVVVNSIAIISLCITLIFFSTLFFFSISKKFAPKTVMFFIKLLYKMKIIKDYRKTFNHIMRIILEYQKTIKYYVRSIWIAIISFLCSALIIVINAFIPYLIYCMFNYSIESGVLFDIVAKFIMIELASKYIPLPGGSGMAELSFSALFASLFADGTLFWAMLVWRFFTYFIYILQGIFILGYDLIHGNKKFLNRRASILELQKRKQLESKKKL